MNKYKCSITIEASLSFSISLFVLFLILGPLFVLESSAYIMNKLNETSKYMSYYQMIEKNLSNFNDRIDIKNISNGNDNNIEIDSNLNNNDIKDSIKNLSNYGIIIADLFAKNVDKNNAYSNISLILPNNTQVYTENNGIIKYDLNIFFKLPLNLFRVPDLYQRFISVRRAFIGVDGNRFINEQGLVENEEIYVSNNYMKSHVYHDKLSCTRLKKITTRVSFHNIKNYKNDDNDDYIKCNYCFKDIQLESNTYVYITTYGIRFHSYESCPLMTAYINIVPRSYIEEYNLRLCEICKNNGN